jgi:hypothetical protein
VPKFERKELEFVIEPQVRPFCGPLFFTDSLETPLGSIKAAGSFGLVSTGTKRLLVTCHHVSDEFHRQRHENPALKLCVCLDRGNPVVFGTDSFIDADRLLDLAIFDAASIFEACGENRFFPLFQKPAPRVSKGDVLLLIGFPGHLRMVVDGALGVGRAPYGVLVTSVDGPRFQSDVTNLKVQSDDFGGISGCPAFRIRPGQPIRLAGFTTSVWMNLLFFTHANCINADGTINRTCMVGPTF